MLPVGHYWVWFKLHQRVLGVGGSVGRDGQVLVGRATEQALSFGFYLTTSLLRVIFQWLDWDPVILCSASPVFVPKFSTSSWKFPCFFRINFKPYVSVLKLRWLLLCNDQHRERKRAKAFVTKYWAPKSWVTIVGLTRQRHHLAKHSIDTLFPWHVNFLLTANSTLSVLDAFWRK